MNKEVLILSNISKSFRIGVKHEQSFLAKIIDNIFSRTETKEIKILNKVSFCVVPKEIVGIIGDNGSGKSTLLRIIAGIYRQDEGDIYTKGKIVSLINLVVGLKERLTMKDNIFLCCSLFNLPQKEIRVKMHSIANFSGLESFMETKIYQFSQGMRQRLSFSIAVHCNPDILLLDEVFEVGDEDFKKKSANKIRELVASGSCVILISHDLEIIKMYCDTVYLLEAGHITRFQSPQEAINKYLEKNVQPNKKQN